MADSRLWHNFFRFRAPIIVLAGLLGFLLGALYLSVAQLQVDSIIVVTGNPHPVTDQSTAIRITAYRDIESRERRATRVSVDEEATLRPAGYPAVAARPITMTVEGHTPAVARFDVPPEAAAGGRLILRVRPIDSAEAREIEIPLTVEPTSHAEPREDDSYRKTDGELAMALVPEDDVLIHGLPNRLFVRVADEDGAGVAAQLALRRGSQAPRNSMSASSGLAAMDIEGGAFQYRFRVTAEDARGRQGTIEQVFKPVPRGRRLRLLPPVALPGQIVRVEVSSTAREEKLHCDILHENRLVDSFTMDVTRARAAASRTIPRVEGIYHVQCAPYHTLPNPLSYAGRALVVTTRDCPVTALAAALQPSDETEREYARWLEQHASRLPSENQAILKSYLAARLVPPYTPSVILHNTLREDREALDARRDALRARLLVALGAALFVLLLWAVALVGSNILETKRNARLMALLMEEEGDDSTPAPEQSGDELPESSPVGLFGAARSGLNYLVFIVLVVLNLFAVLWLLKTVVR